jgi:hypothetical protein
MLLVSSDGFKLAICRYCDRTLPVCEKVFPLERFVTDSVSLPGLFRPKTHQHTPKIRHTINAATTSITATERHTMVLKKLLQLELISLKMKCNLKVKFT